jgi:hypothetical protein
MPIFWTRSKEASLPFEVDLLRKFMTTENIDADRWRLASRNARAYVEPRLAQLPSNYGILFQRSAGWQCNGCMRVPRTPAICLLCGAMLCATDPCCRSSSDVGELTVHARDHNEGHGMFLLLSFCKVVLIYDGFAAPFHSPYLDDHGEEDEGTLPFQLFNFHRSINDAMRRPTTRQASSPRCDSLAGIALSPGARRNCSDGDSRSRL